MSLLSHIDTGALVDVHDDLPKDAFPGKHWYRGTDGVITGSTVPCTFTSASLQLNHYIPEADLDSLNTDVSKVKTISDNVDYVLPVLNIYKVGFFRVTSVTDNQTCTIDYMAPSIQLIINRGLNLDLDADDVTPATGLRWSLGGVEEKIAIAYADLVTELIKRKAITAESLVDNDPSYVQALRAHSLQLIYTSLITAPDDSATGLAAMYYRMYQKELTDAKPYGYEQKAVKRWERG